jgi:pimeloyl-ACP methyl ester carboxylesterase
MLALVLAVTATAACTDGRTGAGFAFRPCGDRIDLSDPTVAAVAVREVDFTCATLNVPLDHAHPELGQLPIQLVRVRHRQVSRPAGSLIMMPPGAGEPGLASIAGWVAWLPEQLLTSFDLVSFDPRGTGRSAPINCGPVAGQDQVTALPDPRTDAGFARAQVAGQRLAEGCLARLGSQARYFTTEQTARDLDQIRDALGDAKLTYVGYSYGAKLGGEYARLFPDRVRAVVLDSPPDPRTDPVSTVTAQVAAFESAFEAYSYGCSNRPTCQPLGDVHRYVLDLVHRANAAPIHGGRAQDTPAATGTDVLDAVTALLYEAASWHVLDDALYQAARGNPGGLFAVMDRVFGRDGGNAVPDAADAGFVITCNDSARTPAETALRAAAAKLRQEHPLFGAYGAWWLIGCRTWQGPRSPLDAPSAPGAPAILVVGTTGDSVTPYSGAVAFAGSLGSGRLVTREGNEHLAFGPSDCVNRLVTAYLVKLAVPRAGTRCQE